MNTQVQAGRGELPPAGTLCHDPTIIRQGDWFYCFSTGPGVRVMRSRDLATWKPLRPVFAANPDWTTLAVPGSTDFWAPEIIRHHGEYRLYYSVSTFGSNTSAIGLATANSLDPDDPAAGWTDCGPVLGTGPADDCNAIDANVFNDFDGGQWLAYGSFWTGIKLRPLDPASGRLSSPDEPAIAIAGRPEAPGAIEGAFVLPRLGLYWLFVSLDFCCRGLDSSYRIAVGRSKSPQGPYHDRSGRPLLDGGGTVIRSGQGRTGSGRFVACGHNSVFSHAGQDWIAYHAYDRLDGGKPKLQVETLAWDATGWPVVPSQVCESPS